MAQRVIPDFRSTLLDVLKANSEKLAFSIGGQNYSYLAFYARVFGIAQKLEKAPQRIGVVANNDVETYASIIAIWWTGNTYLPIDSARFHSIAEGIDAYQAELLCSSLDLKDEVKEIKILVTKNLNSNNQPDIRSNSIQNSAYILSTSGTTGKPKNIPISYGNLAAFVDSFLGMGFPLKPADRFIQMADLCFDMSIISFLIPLCVGASVHPMNLEGLRYVECMRTLVEEKITVFTTAPSTLALLEPWREELPLENLRITFSGAEALHTETAMQWSQCATNSIIVNLYGPSEGGIFTSYHQWNEAQDKAPTVPIGKLASHIEAIVLNGNGQAVTGTGMGELLIRGPQVFSGYTDAALNVMAFSNQDDRDWFKTGDLVQLNTSGEMTFVKRVDQQVKIQGKRIELNLILETAKTLLPQAEINISLQKGQNNATILLEISGTDDTESFSEKLSLSLPPFYPKVQITNK